MQLKHRKLDPPQQQQKARYSNSLQGFNKELEENMNKNLIRMHRNILNELKSKLIIKEQQEFLLAKRQKDREEIQNRLIKSKQKREKFLEGKQRMMVEQHTHKEHLFKERLDEIKKKHNEITEFKLKQLEQKEKLRRNFLEEKQKFKEILKSRSKLASDIQQMSERSHSEVKSVRQNIYDALKQLQNYRSVKDTPFKISRNRNKSMNDHKSLNSQAGQLKKQKVKLIHQVQKLQKSHTQKNLHQFSLPTLNKNYTTKNTNPEFSRENSDFASQSKYLYKKQIQKQMGQYMEKQRKKLFEIL